MRGYRLPPLVFSAEEATVLYMGANLVEELWGETYREAVLGATAKLDNVLPDELRQEVARRRQGLVIGGLTAMDYAPWSGVIDLLRRCIAERRSVNLVYRALSGQETDRCVNPYALTLQFGLWYMIGHCTLRQSLRTFRVDRILQATPGATSYSIPREFDLKAYLAQGVQSEPGHAVAVRLLSGIVHRVRQQHGRWMQILDSPDGDAVARFHTASLDWAAAWVLSLGGAGTVIAPDELRAAVRHTADRIRRSHGDPDEENADVRPGEG
jgi:predicted DNA-binding transcriptional regulator YafY